MATDLERFVEAEGRAERVKDVRKKIDAEGVTYVYYQFISVTGRIMGKGVPSPHWETIAQKGFQLVYGSTANLFTDRHGNYIGYGPEAWELVGDPRAGDLRGAAVGQPRRPRLVHVLPQPRGPRRAGRVSHLRLPRQPAADPGGVRGADRHAPPRRDGAGDDVARLNPDGTPSVEGKTKPYCYHIDQFSELQPIIHKMVEYGQKLGLDMIQGDHEDAPGQIELNFGFDRAERTADNLSTFRQIAKQVGREEGAFPCFMPKPFMGVSANGCHTNISLWKGDENVFLPDGDDVHMPSQLGLNAVGGILEHLRALTCVTASTVNSYRRFWETGFWAPVFADWGYQNRTTALRISSPDRFEYRSVDSAVNPYLALAGLIKVMDDGIQRKLDPGEPEEKNIYEAIEAGKTVRRVPMTLGEALEALEADEVVRSALPGEMYPVFMHYKRDEWERYCATVTDFDREEYLDVLP